MPYCSIEEAWGNDFKTNDSNELNSFSTTDDEFLNLESPSSPNLMPRYQEFNDIMDDNIIDSLSVDKKPENISNDKEDLISFKNNNQHIEHFISTPKQIDNVKDSNMFNIIIYIITGIFLIFVLDIFTKLGKNAN